MARQSEKVAAGKLRAGDAFFSSQQKTRHGLFGLLFLLCLAGCWPTVTALLHAALDFDFCSQILAAPLIVIALVYWRRHEIFGKLGDHPATGSLIFLCGLLVYWLASRPAPLRVSYDALSAAAFGMVLMWAGGFGAVYGTTAFRAAAFPLGLLLVTVPIPSDVLNYTVLYLQSGSTVTARALFDLLGVPVMRHGFVLSLPGLTIEVAKECSSIRSSIALVITCLLAGYLFLRSPWKRTVLVLLAVPLSVFKNGVRIVTLSLLSIYVNPAFMTSDLHRDGGFVFYLLAIAMLLPLILWFRKLDQRGDSPRSTSES